MISPSLRFPQRLTWLISFSVETLAVRASCNSKSLHSFVHEDALSGLLFNYFHTYDWGKSIRITCLRLNCLTMIDNAISLKQLRVSPTQDLLINMWWIIHWPKWIHVNSYNWGIGKRVRITGKAALLKSKQMKLNIPTKRIRLAGFKFRKFALLFPFVTVMIHTFNRTEWQIIIWVSSRTISVKSLMFWAMPNRILEEHESPRNLHLTNHRSARVIDWNETYWDSVWHIRLKYSSIMNS